VGYPQQQKLHQSSEEMGQEIALRIKLTHQKRSRVVIQRPITLNTKAQVQAASPVLSMYSKIHCMKNTKDT
jgi:hypothetical protein